MRRVMHQLFRRAGTLGTVIAGGAICQATGCAPNLSDTFFNLASTILGQLINSYVNDQLGVTPTLF